VGPGWPDEGETFPVRKCLLVVLNEEWWHRLYAERDLAVLEKSNYLEELVFAGRSSGRVCPGTLRSPPGSIPGAGSSGLRSVVAVPGWFLVCPSPTGADRRSPLRDPDRVPDPSRAFRRP
jgi:hypothetical protein